MGRALLTAAKGRRAPLMGRALLTAAKGRRAPLMGRALLTAAKGWRAPLMGRALLTAAKGWRAPLMGRALLTAAKGWRAPLMGRALLTAAKGWRAPLMGRALLTAAKGRRARRRSCTSYGVLRLRSASTRREGTAVTPYGARISPKRLALLARARNWGSAPARCGSGGRRNACRLAPPARGPGSSRSLPLQRGGPAGCRYGCWCRSR